jgi:class 3 adenylate cyclase
VDAWAFCFVFVLVSLLILRMSVLASLGYILLVCISVWSPLQQAGLPNNYLISGATVTMALMTAFKASHFSGIRSFLLEQRSLRQQREVIELRMEIADQIRLLIPKVIAKRIERLVGETSFGVRKAVNKALQPQQKSVVCLHSDIRGFTQATQHSEDFLAQAVIPEITAMNQIIDDLEGVPRKIGDLVFAYFDHADQRKNAVIGLIAAIKLSLITQNVNQSTVLPPIRRYVLLASGSAWVGNMGGNDSSVEITALGSPVNFVARLDELTKQPEIQKVLQIGDIVMSEQMYRLLQGQMPDLVVSKLNLASLAVSVRDFPQVTQLYVVQPSQALANRLATLQHEQQL